MPRTLRLLVFFCLFSITGFAQLTGVIKDTSQNKPLMLASISLLRSADSVLLSFTRADAQGRFSLPLPTDSSFFLLVTYPRYADYTQELTKAHTSPIEVKMITQAVLLQEVIVRGTAAIKMRGDTLAFTADSFKLQQGATVEDLLRRLPGLSVDANGQITAQGQQVQKVLVDGDEFFGDDPTLATRNLQAAAVKEVQIFDKKSDQAQFTGVSDGNEQKTINLKLKDEFKKGYFGKVKGGAGLPERYETQNMLNVFRDKRKFSVYGIAANTNNTSLNWSEEEQFGGGTSMTFSDDGDVYFQSNSDEFGGIGGYYGEGVPASMLVGSSFANKWNADRSKLNAATRIQRITTDAIADKRTQYQLPDTQFFQNENSVRFADRWQVRGNAQADLFLDSANMLIVSFRGSHGKTMLDEAFNSETLSPKSEFINRSNRKITNETISSNAQVGLTWNKKFKTLRRTLSLNVNYNHNNSNSDGFLLTTNAFAQNNPTTEIIDQRKLSSLNKNDYSSRLAYTEPFGKNGTVELSYGLAQAANSQDRLSYDKTGSDYSNLNERFSNSFEFNNSTHRGGLNYTYVKDKLRAGIGSDLAFTAWSQYDLFKDTTRKYSFMNLFPKANFRYKLSTYSNISFQYSANTQAPSLNQLQPVADNSDPLNLVIGNPNLEIAFRQSFRLNYNFYQVIKSRGMWTSLYYNPASNAFANSSVVDASGRRILQTVNVKGNYEFGIWAGYNGNLKDNKAGYHVFLSPRMQRFSNYVNNVENITRSNNWGFEGTFWLRKDKKYYIHNRMTTNYVTSSSSVRPDQNLKYLMGEVSTDINYELPLRFFIMSYLSYHRRQKTEQFPNNNNMFLWNFTLENKISKKQDMRVGVRINDVLNNRFGFDRNVTSNFISERTWNVVARYWLVTFSWNFNKGPQKVEQDFSF